MNQNECCLLLAPRASRCASDQKLRALGGLSAALVLGLAHLGAALLALADEASLAAEVTQFTRLLDFLRESSQQRIEALVVS
jgi:hypothetical protein